MKQVVPVIIVILALLTACQQAPPMIDKQAEINKIENLLETYMIANETQDMELIKKVWANKPDIIVFGTAKEEKLIGWDQIEGAVKNQFIHFQETFLSMSDQVINVNETGNTAWFSAILNYNFIYQGEPKSFEGNRFTGVLEKTNHDWHIVQSHMSVPTLAELD